MYLLSNFILFCRIVLMAPLIKTVTNLLSWMLRQEKKQKYPIFVLNLVCPYSTYDITLDPKKTLVEFKNFRVVAQLFEDSLKQFLQQHNLEIPPEEVKKTAKKEVKSTWNALPRGETLKLELKRATVGLVSRRPMSAKDIVRDVLKEHRAEKCKERLAK